MSHLSNAQGDRIKENVMSERVSYYCLYDGLDVYDALEHLSEVGGLDNIEFHLLGEVLKYVVRSFYRERFEESLAKAQNTLLRLQEIGKVTSETKNRVIDDIDF